MPKYSMVPMLIIPRIKGFPIHGCLSLGATKGVRFVTRVPSGRRTVTAVALPERIITPSITAWPPMSFTAQAGPFAGAAALPGALFAEFCVICMQEKYLAFRMIHIIPNY